MAKTINSIRLLNLARQQAKVSDKISADIDESPEGKALYIAFLSIEQLYRIGNLTKEDRNELEAEFEEYYQQTAQRALRKDFQAQKALNKLRDAMSECDYATALKAAMDLLSMSETPLGSVDFNEVYKLYYKEASSNDDA